MKTMKSLNENSVVIRPYRLIELAQLYGVDRRTFKVWLEPFAEQIGKRIGQFYNITQVRTIFACLELPATISTL